MNLSTVKWAQWDETQSTDLLGLFMCVFIAHNIQQNRPDNFPSYPPDNHHCSDDVYLREGGALEGGTAATALSWWHCYRMAEDIQLVNALDNNNNNPMGYVCVCVCVCEYWYIVAKCLKWSSWFFWYDGYHRGKLFYIRCGRDLLTQRSAWKKYLPSSESLHIRSWQMPTSVKSNIQSLCPQCLTFGYPTT